MDYKKYLEHLPNEVWLYIFHFTRTADILRAFYGLNSRCNELALHHLKTYGYDLRSISKTGFEFICEVLQSDRINIKKLCLSDDDETPFQTELFLAHGFTFDQFTSLHSLSLFEVQSTQTWIAFIKGLPYLSNLTHLKLIKCIVKCDQPNQKTILNEIWKLPKLISVDLDLRSSLFTSIFPRIKTRSSTLKYLNIYHLTCEFYALRGLSECTPQLEHLSMQMDDAYYRILSFVMPALTSLELSVYDERVMEKILTQTSNLRNLKLTLSGVRYNGHQWEKLIKSSLKQLETFQFRMALSKNNRYDHYDFANFFTSFSSQFWLEERKWYVRFHSQGRESEHTYIRCYTIPYAFSDYSTYPGTFLKSTCPNADDYRTYNSVEQLDYNDKFLQSIYTNHPLTKFPNVRHLNILFSNNPIFWSMIQHFEKIESVKIFHTIPELFVERLLNQTTELHSLSLDGCLFPLQYRSSCRLDLTYPAFNFSEADISHISHSPHIRHCQLLLIHVTKIELLQPLIQTLTNLRALIVTYKHKTLGTNTTDNDVEVYLLRSYLPNTAIVRRDARYEHRIRAWIR